MNCLQAVNHCGCIDLKNSGKLWFEIVIYSQTQSQINVAEEIRVDVEWKVRAIRGATTASSNTINGIREVVTELLDEIEIHNHLDPEEIISVVFTTTRDLNIIFPAAIARERPGWNNIPLLDVQQMHVEGSLERCIRVLIHVNTLKSQLNIVHPYLRGAKTLRPDWNLAQISAPASSVIGSHQISYPK